MTQGFPAQPQYAQQPQQFAPPQGYAQPPEFGQTYQQAFPQPPAAPAPMPQQQAAPFFTQQDPYIQAQQGPSVPPAPQPGATQQTDTSGFWGGAASISFDDKKGYVKGSPRGGKILSKSISDQTKMGTGEVLRWKDSTPRKQMVLLLQTAERSDAQDNGQRQLFIKGDLPRATREAFQAVGASDVEIGGWLYAAWVDDKPPSQSGYSPQKIYKCIYAPPGSPDPLAGQHQNYVPQPAVVPPQNYPNPVEQFSGPSVVGGVPQPHATPDQFAAYAAVQANQQAAYAQPQQGPIAQMPQQHAAAIDGMYQQAVQMDPALAAQAQFAPQPGAQQPVPQTMPQQPDPSGQPQQWSPFAPS